MGYKCGGRRRAPWWRQLPEDAHMRATLKAILVVAKEQRRQESGRWGERKEQKDSGRDR